MSSRKKKKSSRKGILTLLAILILLLCFLLHSYLGSKDNLLDLKVDENLIKEEDNEDKMDVSEGGGAVSLTYSNQVVINKETETANLYLKNPSKSRQDLTIEIYLLDNNEELLIAKSGMIPTGYSIKELSLENVNLNKENYKGFMKLYFYDEETNDKELVDSKINVDIKVN